MSMIDHKVWLYIGTYASVEEAGIHVATMNRDTGELELVSSVTGVENPSYLAVSPDGSHLYAVSEKDEGEVLAYAVHADTHELHLLDRQSTEGGAPCYVELTPDGRHLLGANYTGANVCVFPIREDGTLAPMSGHAQHEGSGTHPERQDHAHTHSIVPALDGQMVYVSDLGTDRITAYQLDEAGAIKEAGHTSSAAAAGPRHLVFHPNGQLAYGVNELDSTVTAYMRHVETGILEALGTLSTLPEDFEGENTGGDIRLSLCGRYVYASNRGHDSIVQYQIDEQSGKLETVEWVPVKGRTPRNLAVLPGGYVLASNQDSNNIVQFATEPDSGRLTPTGHELTLNRPVCVMADRLEIED
ncbi:lactonase family protein [Paenibacillus hunanensis]|uniref:6-phosphogluconolactonase n=1 Tax=Paenibacillus hunanensis TaxID=539262 RepID=A0ABU1IZD6_9BACL|nr:lactonase family protein [Paenibacillus hunanensis]MDR6244072.1 6-phosphogluconolactonase [Paenibacillus hunanensis]GGJ14854.1 6-phosphogluconolactonase [Paenibacillus hunanensis]